MNGVRVWTSSGETWATSVATGEDEARRYFLNQWFNIGPRMVDGKLQEDYMVKVTRFVWWPEGGERVPA